MRSKTRLKSWYERTSARAPEPNATISSHYSLRVITAGMASSAFLDPGCDVGSVLFRVVRNTAFRSEKYAGEFCAKFLFGVRRIAEAVAFVECLAVQTGG